MPEKKTVKIMAQVQVITGGDVNALKVKTRRIWVGKYLLRNGCRGIEHQYKTDEQRKKT